MKVSLCTGSIDTDKLVLVKTGKHPGMTRQGIATICRQLKSLSREVMKDHFIRYR